MVVLFFRRSREEQNTSGASAAASKQDYSLFLKFQTVGSKDGFNHQQHSTVPPHNGTASLSLFLTNSRNNMLQFNSVYYIISKNNN